MGFKEVLVKVKKSEEFRKFEKEHSEAFLYAGFFVINELNQFEQRQLDFYTGHGKVMTFAVTQDEKGNESIVMKEEVTAKDTDVAPLDHSVGIDLEQVQEIIKKECEKEGMPVNKIIAILQKLNGNQVWNVTTLLPSLFMLRITIGMNGKILERKNGSVFDIMQKKSENQSVS